MAQLSLTASKQRQNTGFLSFREKKKKFLSVKKRQVSALRNFFYRIFLKNSIVYQFG